MHGKGSCLHKLVKNKFGQESLRQLMIFANGKMHYSEYVGENFNHKVKNFDL